MVNQSYEWVEREIVFKPELNNWQSAVRDFFLEAGIGPYNEFSLDWVLGVLRLIALRLGWQAHWQDRRIDVIEKGGSVLSLGYWTNLLSLKRLSTCIRGTRPYLLRPKALPSIRSCPCPVSVIVRRHSSKDQRWTRDLFSRSDAYCGNKERSLLLLPTEL